MNIPFCFLSVPSFQRYEYYPPNNNLDGTVQISFGSSSRGKAIIRLNGVDQEILFCNGTTSTSLPIDIGSMDFLMVEFYNFDQMPQDIYFGFRHEPKQNQS